MKGIRHPLTKAVYERDGQGGVIVTDGDHLGTFTADGRWIEGDLRDCDPQLCGWVAGPQIAHHRIVEAQISDE
ncbi:MAG TPA: hypothetical protein VMW08_04910 [Acidimicrobiales bacterium]|nr:hypothetical protein [Acidimicrobiales bacterium]